MKKELKKIFKVEIVDSAVSSKAMEFFFESFAEAKSFVKRTRLQLSGWKIIYKRVFDTINFEKGLWCWKAIA